MASNGGKSQAWGRLAAATAALGAAFAEFNLALEAYVTFCDDSDIAHARGYREGVRAERKRAATTGIEIELDGPTEVTGYGP